MNQFKNNLFIFLCVTSFLFLGKGAVGQTNQSEYHKYVATAQKIVKGRIIERKPIPYVLDGVTKTCGWVLDIAVDQSWKGGKDTFQLFSTHSDIYINTDPSQVYFIFGFRTFKYDPEKQSIDFVECDGLNSARLDVSQFEYLVTGLKQKIFPLITYDDHTNEVDINNKPKTGEWMLVLKRISNAFLPETIERRRLNNGNDNIIEEMKFSDFLDEFLPQ
jgi:hypothetical protein